MTTKKIALIATGNEITDGDIQNTTGPAIARQLAEYGFTITEHRLIPDDEVAIEQAICDLLRTNGYLFITGGLGPTSDDRTRFALANALKKTLLFDEASWAHIVTRMQRFGLAIPSSNRQQALFPTGARILVNANGTANGCHVTEQGKQIFMLPGPPHECLPMFEQDVLPHLPRSQRHKLTYLLFGASESDIAELIDNALAGHACRTGYRADPPYLECKIWADDATALQHYHQIVEPLLAHYFVSFDTIPASDVLITQLQNDQGILRIHDSATQGALQSRLSLPNTVAHLTFLNEAQDADIVISGLDTFWQASEVPTDIVLEFRKTGQRLTQPLRRRSPTQSKTYAVEWLCWQILRNMSEITPPQWVKNQPARHLSRINLESPLSE